MRHSFKCTPEFCFVLLAFFAVIVLANYGSCGGDVKPFTGSSFFSKYEGFEDNEPSKRDSDSIPEDLIRSVEQKTANGIEDMMNSYERSKKKGLETEAFSTLTKTAIDIRDEGNLPKKKALAKIN